MKVDAVRDHGYYMEQALKEAEKAAQVDEVPIGAVVVAPDGSIIARAYNRVEQMGCQTGHAEVSAIQQACAHVKNWRLNGCWIYVTLEPCTMCMGLIYLSRFEGLVYGAESPLFGAQLDKGVNAPLYQRHALEIVRNIGSQESVRVLQQFFKTKREHDEWGRKK